LTAADGAKAYFTAINQQGGFDGHPLELVVRDDQSSTTGAATATEELISARVHAIIPDSSFFYGGYKAAQQAGVPVVGPNIDGPEWGLQPNTNMFPAFLGGADAKHPVVQSSLGAAAVLQFLGAKNVGALTYGISPTAVSVVNDLKTALTDIGGIKMGYENTSLNIGTTDVTSPALAMKGLGIDAVVCACLENTELALNTTLQQEGVKASSISLDTPDSVAFDTPAAKQASQDVYFFSLIAPLTTPASMVFENRLHAVYPGYTVGTYMTSSIVSSYVAAALIYKGLQGAGADPTNQALISSLSKVTNWTGEGLLPAAISFNHFGTAQQNECQYFVQLKGTTFVSLNNGKPICVQLPSNL
jgi:branched-chain amino acid transport system substrate-binding protein